MKTKKNYLGIDIGGTKIRGVIVDDIKFPPLHKFLIKTPNNKRDFLKALEREIKKFEDKKSFNGIGVGLPGAIDFKRGIFIKAPNIHYLKNWPAKKFFLEFSKKVLLDNDSRCFLRAEKILGAAKNFKNIAALTIGTGIGGGLIINGKIYKGKNGTAGEFGYMITDNYKTLEQLGAKKAYLKSGDRSKIIGIGVANVINAFDPDAVVLGGGGVVNNKVKLSVVKKIARKFIMSPLSKKTPIIKSKIGEFSSAIGAALLFEK